MVNNTTTITCGFEIADRLRDFIGSHFLIQFDGEINDASDLFALGIIDSFGFIELITFIEKTFRVELRSEDLMADKLNSIATMVALIRSQHHD